MHPNTCRTRVISMHCLCFKIYNSCFSQIPRFVGAASTRSWCPREILRPLLSYNQATLPHKCVLRFCLQPPERPQLDDTNVPPLQTKIDQNRMVLTSAACPESPSGSLADRRTANDAPRGPLSARNFWSALGNFWFRTFFPIGPPPRWDAKTPHPARAPLTPALTDGDTHPLHTSPRIQCRGDSTPAPMTCFPLTNPRTCCPAPHGPGCAFAEGRVLPTRRVGEAAIRPERRAAKQNERPLQQAQGTVRLPGVAATPAHTHTHATPARQSWMSARRYLSTPLLEMAIPLVFPGRCACTRVYLCSTAVTLDLT